VTLLLVTSGALPIDMKPLQNELAGPSKKVTEGRWQTQYPIVAIHNNLVTTTHDFSHPHDLPALTWKSHGRPVLELLAPI